MNNIKYKIYYIFNNKDNNKNNNNNNNNLIQNSKLSIQVSKPAKFLSDFVRQDLYKFVLNFLQLSRK